MRKKIIIYSSVTIAVLAVVYFMFFNDSNADESQFVFAQITKGDLNTIITSTGTLQALSTVDVGTQVSGKIDKILVDFNDKVKKGQLLAIVDTTNLALQVKNASISLQKAQAQYDVSKAQYERDKMLYEKSYISELDLINSKSNYETADATLKSSRISLAQSKTNMGYAFIYSPINGKIITRSIEEGQTVAASFSSPTLFTIAEDLSQMEILADVDEGDIGQIKEGQETKFTVQAYPDKEFTGKVVQIRLGSTVVSNVVNYTVVINANNDDYLLLPGMTATIDFLTDQRSNVLMIPNAALRFQPTQQMMEEFFAEMQKRMENSSDSSRTGFRPQGGPPAGQNGGGFAGGFGGNGGSFGSDKSRGTFWYIDKEGKPAMGFAMLGLSDGKNTEIVRSRNAEKDMQVITRVETNAPTQQNSNPASGLGRGMRRF